MRLLPLIIVALLVGCDSKTSSKTSTTAGKPEMLMSAPSLSTTGQSEPNVHDISAGYKGFDLLTDKPVFVDRWLAMSCVHHTPAELDALAVKVSGPHAHSEVMIYMNDLAAAAFRRSAVAYPVGSIIVKEKWAVPDQGTANEQGPGTRDGVGGMVKRSPGYDPQHGDWEYFYFDDPAKIQSGAMDSCVQCHAGAAGTDHVFGSWAKSR